MSEHTQEPWLINENCADEVGVLCAENTQEYGSIVPILLAYGYEANANALRIVACVNSLAGVPNELLQDDEKNIINRYTEHLKKETVRHADLLAEVTAQRDELKMVRDLCLHQISIRDEQIGSVYQNNRDLAERLASIAAQRDELLAAMKIVTTGTVGDILDRLHEFQALVVKCEAKP